MKRNVSIESSGKKDVCALCCEKFGFLPFTGKSFQCRDCFKVSLHLSLFLLLLHSLYIHLSSSFSCCRGCSLDNLLQPLFFTAASLFSSSPLGILLVLESPSVWPGFSVLSLSILFRVSRCTFINWFALFFCFLAQCTWSRPTQRTMANVDVTSILVHQSLHRILWPIMKPPSIASSGNTINDRWRNRWFVQSAWWIKPTL